MKPRIYFVSNGLLCLDSSLLAQPFHRPPFTRLPPNHRPFSTTPLALDWLVPKGGMMPSTKTSKGRPRVCTGGSTRGTTVIWGDYGLRMRDHDRRISAAQLAVGAEAVKKRLRGLNYRLYYRINADVAVYTSGNEVRMGKGKGSFDHWAARVAVSRILFELKGDLHEQIVRDAFRLAGNKLPGLYEFVRKGDPPVMGITKVREGVTVEDLHRPRVKLPVAATAARLPATSPP
ncbi:MAG: ribosomal L16 [Lasallia pustulata]|nr:MAG: ribosomal L16 [Lasallia pustulata]